MKKIKILFHVLGFLLLMSILSSCVSTGLKVINKLAKSDDYEVFTDLVYGEKPNNKLDIYIPKNKKVKATLVFFYGGCWGNCTDYNKSDYLFVAGTLSKQGYAVVIADYRQYPDFKFNALIQDASQAVKWTIKHIKNYGAEDDKLFLMGHSSGAHIAAMLADNEKYLGDKLSHINGFIGLAGPYDFYPFTDDYMYDLFSPENDYFDAMPINFVNGNEPPHLIMHGLKDHTVFLHNPNNLTEKLQANGVETTKVLLEKMSHAKILVSLSKPFRKKSPVLKHIVEFVDKYSKSLLSR
ncbi:MAG: alpha/beta hydrolase [Proteobacteria bacterium]|nr:alpha/beta hydrolase [Pseudomonadota bacterium]